MIIRLPIVKFSMDWRILLKTGKVTNMKYDDPNRGALDSESGGRDIPVMRSAEMYLVRAEAYGRRENTVKAIERY